MSACPEERAKQGFVTAGDDENSSHDFDARALSSRMSEIRDQDALALLRRRDERGFDLAYARYAQRVFGFLVRLSRSRAVAEDLLQHTFLRLAEVGPRLRPDSDLRAWLFTVARNAFQSHLRARGAASRVDPEWLPTPAFSEPQAGLELLALERALARLSAEDRELLLLVGVEGLSYAEMAAVLSIDVVTVRKRISRARERLAQVLDAGPTVVRKSELKP